MNPRIAATTMKTVPSGRVLVCMNGALERFGTVTENAVTAPERVGRPVRAASEVALVPVMVGTVAEDADEPDPVIVTPLVDDAVLVVVVPVAEALFEPVFDAVIVADPDPVACGAVDRLGRAAESVEAAEAAITRAIATARDCCRTLIVYARRYGLKKSVRLWMSVRDRGSSSQKGLSLAFRGVVC
jgi:hypothetical protein